MIECKTLAEAQAVENVIHVVAGKTTIAYQVGDRLPGHCKVDTSLPQPKSRAEQLEELTDEQFAKLLEMARA